MLAMTAHAAVCQDHDEAFPKTPYPMGFVIDEDGNAVAGASIRIRVDHPDSFGRVLHQLLQTQPRISVRSGRDGGYVLPLTEGQRHLATAEARLSLVVEKDGYLPWIEHLPGGIYGYLGSRAVLRRPTPRDRLSFAVEDPAPSMILLVERVVLSGQAHSLGSSLALPVPPDGRVQTVLSMRPDPPQFSPSSRSLSIRLEARLLYPGRSTPPQLVNTSSDLQRLTAAAPAPAPGRAVGLQRGGKPTGLRGLYRCPDGRLRWFELPGETAPQDPFLKLVAVAADGHLATVRPGAAKLRELPHEGIGARRIQVTHEGVPVPEARAQLLPLELWTESSTAPLRDAIGARPLSRVRGDEHGTLTLPAKLPDEPGFLLVQAPGFEPARIVEPRGLGQVTELSLKKTRGGSLRLTVLEADGQAVPGASLLFSDTAFATGILNESLPRTDAKGTFELLDLPPGAHMVGVVAQGHEPAWKSLSIREGQHAEVGVTLERTVRWRILCVDDKDRPVPFTTVEHIETTGGTTRSHGVFATDSFGRAVVDHSGRRLSLRSSRQGWRVEFDDPSRVHRIRVKPTPLVMVALEPGTGILQENWLLDGAIRSRFTISGKGGSSRILTRWLGDRDMSGCWIVDRGPPIRLRGEEVMAAWTADPGQVVMIDRSKTTRSVPVRVRADAAPPPAEELRVIYRSGGGVVNLSLAPGQLLEDGPEGLHLALRDDDELPCCLLHPDFVPLNFTVPEKTGDDTSLELQLERGVGLSFEVTFSKIPRPDAVMTLRVRDRASGAYVLNTIDRLPPIAPEDLDKPLEIRSPAALPAGRFNVYFRIPGFPTLSADVNLQEGKPAVLQVAEPKNR